MPWLDSISASLSQVIAPFFPGKLEICKFTQGCKSTVLCSYTNDPLLGAKMLWGTADTLDMQPVPFFKEERCIIPCLAEHMSRGKNPTWLSWGSSEINPLPKHSAF